MAITQTSHAAKHLGGTGLCALERRRLTEHALRILRGRNAACLHLISQLRGRDEQVHQQIIPVQHALYVLRRRATEVALDNTRHVLGGGMPQLVRQAAGPDLPIAKTPYIGHGTDAHAAVIGKFYQISSD